MDATQLIDTFPIDARQTERQTPLSSLRAISMLDLFPLNWPSLKKGKLFFFFCLFVFLMLRVSPKTFRVDAEIDVVY